MKLLKEFQAIFLDFDGVIKDSVEIKSNAFEQLFLPFGDIVANRVRMHHEDHTGMSRFDKLPIYLQWAGLPISTSLMDEFSNNFSLLVKRNVINSPWVDGLLNFLNYPHDGQLFFLVTATPQLEIEEILFELDIYDHFEQIIGSPTVKGESIKMLLDKYKVDIKRAVMVGDSKSDYEAAILNNIQFVLRKTELNKSLQSWLNCQMIDNFL